MRKFWAGLCLFILMFWFATPCLAAMVTPQRFDGNDSNPNEYTPPAGCIHYEIPGSGNEGTYTVKFKSSGDADPNGILIFTVTVGKAGQNEYTQVLEWESNFSLYAVIVKGGDAFNLYAYPDTVRTDTDLVSPNNASGQLASVSHVSIVLCPGSLPTPTIAPTPTGGADGECCNFLLVIVIVIIAAFLLIGILIGAVFFYRNKQHNKCC